VRASPDATAGSVGTVVAGGSHIIHMATFESVTDCVLDYGSSHRWHDAAHCCQLSNAWRTAITSWRNGQSRVSISSRKSDGQWLDAWDRPAFDVLGLRALVHDTPRCSTVELLWWTLDSDAMQEIGERWPQLTSLLLETCAINGTYALQPLFLPLPSAPCAHKLRRLSMWTCNGACTLPFLAFLRSCTSLQAVTLNLQAYTQARRDAPQSRVCIDAGRLVETLSTISTLQRVALYELASDDGWPYSDQLAKLSSSCALTSFKVAEALDITEDDLGGFNGALLELLDWGASRPHGAQPHTEPDPTRSPTPPSPVTPSMGPHTEPNPFAAVRTVTGPVASRLAVARQASRSRSLCAPAQTSPISHSTTLSSRSTRQLCSPSQHTARASPPSISPTTRSSTTRPCARSAAGTRAGSTRAARGCAGWSSARRSRPATATTTSGRRASRLSGR